MSGRCRFRSAVGFALTVCLTTPAPAFAQRAAAVALKAGIAIDTLNIVSPGAARRTETKAGFIGGLALTVPTARTFGFQGEFLINERSAISTTLNEPSENVALIVVPLLLRIRLADVESTRISLLVGPEIAAHITRGQGMVRENDDYSIAVGADIVLTQRFVIDVRYTRGLVTLEPTTTATESVKNRGIAVMAGWRFY